MRPAWHLVISSFSSRRRRTTLLASVIAVAAALVVAVTLAMASINNMLESQLGFMFGSGDIQIRNQSARGVVLADQLASVQQWPEVSEAIGSVEADIALVINRPIWSHDTKTNTDTQETQQIRATAHGNGLDFAAIQSLRPIDMLEGRLPKDNTEITIGEGVVTHLNWDRAAARRGIFSVVPSFGNTNADENLTEAHRNENLQQRIDIGDTVVIQRFRKNVAELTVVGIAKAPPLGGRAQVYTTVAAMRVVAGYTEDQSGGYTQLDLVLTENTDAETFVQLHKDDLGDDMLLRSTAKVTSGLNESMQSSQLGLILVVVLAGMSAGFIIVTGLNTAIAQQQRELAIVRCIGGTRFQLAQTQLITGLLLGLLGAAVGVPLGIGVLILLGIGMRDILTTGIVINWLGPVLGVTTALLAGVGGALWPAVRVAKLQPLQSLTPVANPTPRRALVAVAVVAIVFMSIQALIVTIPRDGQIMFWMYASAGLPLLFLGYFLLGVPITLGVTKLCGPLLSRVFGLPSHLLVRSIESSPFRYGLTAGALMTGLTLMVGIWSSSDSVLRDWLGKLDFPDAFVSGIALTQENQNTLDALPFVTGTCALSLVRVENNVFGVEALQQLKSTFIAFEPEPFFKMTRLKWIQGNETTAIEKLRQGGAIIVAKEFLLAKGLGVGDTFACSYEGIDHEFEIVGVIASPGLELASRFFNIGSDFHEQAMHAVFGSTADAKQLFNVDARQLIQIQFARGTDDDQAVETIRTELFDAGIIDAGSGRRIKETISTFASTSVLAFSVVAIVAMFVACFGVANIIMASIEARRFEFGILRAVGAMQGVLVRLVLAEAIIIAIAAVLLGTAMGLQAAWAATKIHRLLHGLDLHARIPFAAIAIGSAILIALTVGAALPAILRLGKVPPRELLASGR